MKPGSLYLLRHAQSAASLEVEEAQWPLSRLGKRQATALADLLAPLNIRRVYSSPYLRARQTIEPFAEKAGLRFILDTALVERRLSKDALAQFGKVWRKSWDDLDYAPPGCESSLEAQERFTGAVRRIVQQTAAETIAVCAHGHVSGLFLRHLDGAFGRERTEALRNPDVLRIDVSRTEWALDEAFMLPGLEDVAAGRFTG
jgi:2,3-bisphosphoglycerate-dependent phosphoglycerate mutase